MGEGRRELPSHCHPLLLPKFIPKNGIALHQLLQLLILGLELGQGQINAVLEMGIEAPDLLNQELLLVRGSPKFRSHGVEALGDLPQLIGSLDLGLGVGVPLLQTRHGCRDGSHRVADHNAEYHPEEDELPYEDEGEDGVGATQILRPEGFPVFKVAIDPDDAEVPLVAPGGADGEVDLPGLVAGVEVHQLRLGGLQGQIAAQLGSRIHRFFRHRGGDQGHLLVPHPLEDIDLEDDPVLSGKGLEELAQGLGILEISQIQVPALLDLGLHRQPALDCQALGVEEHLLAAVVDDGGRHKDGDDTGHQGRQKEEFRVETLDPGEDAMGHAGSPGSPRRRCNSRLKPGGGVEVRDLPESIVMGGPLLGKVVQDLLEPLGEHPAGPVFQALLERLQVGFQHCKVVVVSEDGLEGPQLLEGGLGLPDKDWGQDLQGITELLGVDAELVEGRRVLLPLLLRHQIADGLRVGLEESPGRLVRLQGVEGVGHLWSGEEDGDLGQFQFLDPGWQALPRLGPTGVHPFQNVLQGGPPMGAWKLRSQLFEDLVMDIEFPHGPQDLREILKAFLLALEPGIEPRVQEAEDGPEPSRSHPGIMKGLDALPPVVRARQFQQSPCPGLQGLMQEEGKLKRVHGDHHSADGVFASSFPFSP